MDANQQIDPFLGISEVEAETHRDRSTIYRQYTADPPTFPSPQYIGNRRVWRRSAIAAWLEKELGRSAEERLGAKNLGVTP